VQTQRRGDIDDPPAPIRQQRQRGLRTEIGAGQIDPQDLVPDLVAIRIQRIDARNTGIVDQHVQSPADSLKHGAHGN
jgi:hypothetical protein